MIYGRQVELLLDCLPFVFSDKRVALKGGTALNLFAHDCAAQILDARLHSSVSDRKKALVTGMLNETDEKFRGFGF